MSHLMLIGDAKARGVEKEHLVLAFLLSETFSSFDNFSFLLQSYSSNTSVLLKRMVAKGFLVKRSGLALGGRTVNLWGITRLGLEQFHGAIDDYRPFRKCSLSPFSLSRKLLLQRVRLDFSRFHSGDWLSLTYRHPLKERYSLNRYPAAIFRHDEGAGSVAVEVDLILKTPSRYRTILQGHIVACRKGLWSQVVFIVADSSYRQALCARLKRVRFVVIDSSRHPFERYESMFRVVACQKLLICDASYELFTYNSLRVQTSA